MKRFFSSILSFLIILSFISIPYTVKATNNSDINNFHSFQNNTFWKDTDGNPIYSQGGGIFKFGDTYYWYGVKYTGAESYYNNPTKKYSNTTNDVKFVAITCYSSKDLVNWKFENNIADTSTILNIDTKEGEAFSSKQNLGESTWIGRLGVTYNKNTNKYVLLVQMEFGDANPCVLFIQSDTPTGDFEYANIQKWIEGSPTQGTGDQTVFIDDDGSAYLIFSKRKGRDKSFVAKISDNNSLSIEPAVEVASVSNGKIADGREGNTMFKKDGKYYIAMSDLHGWNSSVTHIIESDSVQGTYSKEYTLKGTEKDYSHVTQTGFFVSVQGSKEETVVYCGDRWADFAWNGIGYNQWAPLSFENGEPYFNSLSQWELNATTGEWKIGENNNYILNPNFEADRVKVTSLTGWTTKIDEDFSTNTFASNQNKNGTTENTNTSQWSLNFYNANKFSGSVYQENTIPRGNYNFSARIYSPGELEYAKITIESDTGAQETYSIDINKKTTGWETFTLENIKLTGGTANVSIQARSNGGGKWFRVDDLSLTKKSVDRTQLEILYNANKGKTQDNYTDESWAAFVTALDNAQAKLSNDAILQEEVDTAKIDLDNAVKGLIEKPVIVNKEVLQKLYDDNKDKSQGNYTDESWNAFIEALNKAKETLAKSDATQEEADNTKKALNKAINELKIKTTVIVKDEESGIIIVGETGVIEEGTTVKVNKITDGNLYEFTANLVNKDNKFFLYDISLGNGVQPNGTVKVSLPIPEEFNKDNLVVYNISADGKIKTKMDGYVDGNYYVFETTHFSYYALVEEVKVSTTVNTDELKAKVNEVEGLKESDYTEESWSILKEALAAAKEVLNSSNINQETIDKAYEELVNAENTLKKKDSNLTPGSDTETEDKDNNESSQGDLPQTGRTSTSVWLGLSGLLIVLGAILLKKSKRLKV